MLAYVPPFVFAALVVALGIDFLWAWIVEARARITRLEWGVVVAITAAAALVDFLAAIVLGLALSVGALRVELRPRAGDPPDGDAGRGAQPPWSARPPRTLRSTPAAGAWRCCWCRATSSSAPPSGCWRGSAGASTTRMRRRSSGWCSTCATSPASTPPAVAVLRRMAALLRRHGAALVLTRGGPPVAEAVGRAGDGGLPDPARPLDDALAEAEEALLAAAPPPPGAEGAEGGLEALLGGVASPVRFARGARLLAAGEPSDHVLLLRLGAGGGERPRRRHAPARAGPRRGDRRGRPLPRGFTHGGRGSPRRGLRAAARRRRAGGAGARRPRSGGDGAPRARRGAGAQGGGGEPFGQPAPRSEGAEGRDGDGRDAREADGAAGPGGGAGSPRRWCSCRWRCGSTCAGCRRPRWSGRRARSTWWSPTSAPTTPPTW